MGTSNPLTPTISGFFETYQQMSAGYQQAMEGVTLGGVAFNQGVQQAIITGLTDACQARILQISEGYTIDGTVAASEFPPAALAIFGLGTGASFILAHEAAGFCTAVSSASVQQALATYQSLVNSDVAPLLTTNQESHDLAAYDQALSTYNFSGLIAATDQLAKDANFVGVTNAGGDTTYQEYGLSVTVSPNWQPLQLTSNNADGTSQITTFASDGSSTSTTYSGPNGTGPIIEVDQYSPSDTEQIMYLANVGGNGVTPSSNVISITNGSATDTANSITGSEWAIDALGPLTVSNYGTITGGLDGIILNAGGTITNGSTSDVTAIIASTSGLGINFGGANASQLTNFGIVSGGIEVSGTGSLTVTNGSATDTKASIQAAAAGADGIYAGATTLQNFGSIYGANDGLGLAVSSVVNGSTADTAASISGGFGMAFSGSGTSTVINFGSITGTYSDAVRLFGSGGGSVTNGSSADKTATITGAGYGVDSAGGSVTNDGTIIGAAGIYLGSGTVTNAGLIESTRIIDSLGDHGTAIQFGSAGGHLVEDPGSTIIGQVYGSGCTVELASGTAAGTTGGFGNNITGVSAVAVDAGASWTLTGANTIASVTDDGTLAIASGSSLDVSSAVAPSSTGIFQLTGKSSLEIAALLGSGAKIQFLGSAPSNDLIIDKAASFGTNVGTASYVGPLLEDFAAGDTIDLKSIAATEFAYATNGDLQLTGSGGTALATLAFQNSTLGTGTFHLASDGAGGTLLTHS